MTIAYHGTPITPAEVLMSLRGRHFCVSFYAPHQIRFVDEIAQTVMVDNGSFSAWKQGCILDAAYWARFYAFCELWCERPTTWAVIPDVIDAGTQEQDALLREWPADLRDRGAPVWHMDEPIDRLKRLIDEWPKVCIGSTAEYRTVRSVDWTARMDETWNVVMQGRRFAPWIHMLRGMQLLRPDCRWPFASVDSTDLARNHNRLNDLGPEIKPLALKLKADRWDAWQCPPRFIPAPYQTDLLEAVA